MPKQISDYDRAKTMSPEEARDYIVSSLNDGTYMTLTSKRPEFVGGLYEKMQEGELKLSDHPNF